MPRVFLPPELWVHVFDHLSVDSLLELTLVCDAFKCLVEDSAKLMRKITLNLDNTNIFEAVKLTPIRRYRNVKIDRSSEVPAELLEIMGRQSKYIEDLKIMNSSFSASDVEKLLVLFTQHFETLTLVNTNLTARKSEGDQLCLRRLKKLNILKCDDKSSNDWLKILHIEEIEEFCYLTQSDAEEKEVITLIEFLKSLKKLKRLFVCGNLADKLGEFPKTVTNLHSCWIELKNIENTKLANFLRPHQNSLRELCLGKTSIDEELLNQLASFSNLSSLRFCASQLKSIQNLEINKHVKELSLCQLESKETDLCKLLRSMSEVGVLDLSSMIVTFDVSIVIAYEMKKLTQLTVDKCDAEPTTFPSVTNLKLVGCSLDVTEKLLLVNRHVKTLEIEVKYKDELKARESLSDVKILYV